MRGRPYYQGKIATEELTKERSRRLRMTPKKLHIPPFLAPLLEIGVNLPCYTVYWHILDNQRWRTAHMFQPKYFKSNEI